MTLIVLAYLAGVLTLLSPCVLPILPFVFSRAGQPFVRSVLPLLVGLAVTFTGLALLVSVGGGWIVQANEVGRIAAMVLLALLGVLLLSSRLADYAMRPFVAFGNRLSETVDASGGGGSVRSVRTSGGRTAAGSFVIGIATGFLWAPCAGPILGLILTGAALQGASPRSALLLGSYAAGAATALAVVLLIGGRVYAVLKRSLGAGEWVRRALGVAVLAAVAVIGLGLDTSVLTQWSVANTSRMEQALLDAFHPARGMKGSMTASAGAAGAARGESEAPGAAGGAAGAAGAAATTGASGLPDEGVLPPLTGAVDWINSPPLTPQSLRGKVVLIDFWTYSCINCLRTLPYVRGWWQKYKDHGLVVIGVHTPEFAFEKNLSNVRAAVRRLKITYPVAVDSNYAIWGAFSNQYWPADYFIDATGHIRGHQFGEGDYQGSERLIQELLRDAGYRNVPGGYVSDEGTGAEAAPDMAQIDSPETYIGYEKSQGFQSAQRIAQDRPAAYSVPGALDLNQWGLAGVWTIHGERAVLDRAPGRIVFRFHARDLNLVLGPASTGAPIRFKVLMDGAAPGAVHGADTNAQGEGVVRQQRLYQLIRQSGAIGDHTFTIEFLDPGLQAYSFTFG
ncbi:MAG: cytochrome c biogenesis protein DipZ [Steroidobacteraceae bacterium]